MAKKKVRDAPVGVIRVSPKKKSGKNISKSIRGGVAGLLAGKAAKELDIGLPTTGNLLGDLVGYSLAGKGIEKVGSITKKKALQQKAIQKLIKEKGGKSLLKKLATSVIPGMGAVGAGLALNDVYDIGKLLFSDKAARNFGEKDEDGKGPFKSAEDARAVIPSAIIENLGIMMGDVRKSTKERMAKNKKQVFKRNKKDILKSIERKKGGKVGRPKGVGCATKGYGKAMKRGK